MAETFKNRWRILFISFFSMFSFLFFMQAIPQILPLVIEDFGLKFTQASSLMWLVALSGLFISIPGGLLAGRYGLRRLSITGAAIITASSIFCAYPSTFFSLQFGRLLLGIVGSLIVRARVNFQKTLRCRTAFAITQSIEARRKMLNAKNIATITRANFLPLSIVIVCAGWSAALWRHGVFSLTHGLLAMAGALLTHAAANVFNNYFDYRSGIDARTPKTPFSGGVELLVTGEMKPYRAFLVGSIALFGAILIGIYFLTLYFSYLIPILLYGLVSICFYTPFLSRFHSLSEIIAGTSFGFMGLGAYIVQAGIIDSTGLALFVPISILVGLLLFLNEFPDVDADKFAGRKHIVALVGRKTSARIYVLGLLLTYISVVVAVAWKATPFHVLFSLITIPIAYKAGSRILRDYDNMISLTSAQGLNVITILTTILLIATGFFLAFILH